MNDLQTLELLSRDVSNWLNAIPRDIIGEIRQCVIGRPRHVPRDLRVVDTIESFTCSQVSVAPYTLYDITVQDDGSRAANIYDLINRDVRTVVDGEKMFTINGIHYIPNNLLPGATTLTATRLDTGEVIDMPFTTSDKYTATGRYLYLSDYLGVPTMSLKEDNSLVLEPRDIDIVPCDDPRGLVITGYVTSTLTFSTGETTNIGNYVVLSWKWSGNRIILTVVKNSCGSDTKYMLLGEHPTIYDNIVFLGNGMYLCQKTIGGSSYVYDGVDTYSLPDGLPLLNRVERAMVNGVIRPTLVSAVNDKISMFECVY